MLYIHIYKFEVGYKADDICSLPSGKLLHNYGKSLFCMGKYTVNDHFPQRTVSLPIGGHRSPGQAGVHVLPSDEATKLAFFETLAEEMSSRAMAEGKRGGGDHWEWIGR